MKVKNVNVSSIRTKNKIIDSFIELLNEKRELNLISVTELVKRADITRSSFYTHYNNIYDIAKEIEEGIVSKFFDESYKFNSIDDVYNYIDMIINYIKDNEDMYKKLFSSNDSILMMEKFRKETIKRIVLLLNESNLVTSNNIELDVSFFVDGIVVQIIKYLRNQYVCTLDELSLKIKFWFTQIFNNKNH